MKIRSILRLVALATIAALVITTVPWLIGAALAATGNAPVVPPPTPDALMVYVENYGWLVGGLTAAYLAAKWLLKRNESTHWIAQGRALAIVTTVIGVGWTALQAYTSGTPWSGVLVTALLGLLHLADAQVLPTPAPKTAQGGFCRLSVMVALAAIGAVLPLLLASAATLPAAGCHNPKVVALEHALWDCTAPERADAVAAVTPAVVSVIKAAGTADGKAIDLSTVKSAISKANVLSEAGVLLSCAMASAVAILMAPTPAPVAGAPAAAPFVLDPAAVRTTWAAVKQGQLGGADFKVAGGAVL